MQSNVDILKGVNFDSSLSNIDATVSDEEYKRHLTTLLQSILDQRFPNNLGKQRIRLYRDRIAFACPICGDSVKSNYKKRGNFILKGKFSHFFKCHNCGASSRIDQFFKGFKIDLDLGVINYISKGVQDFSSYTDAKYDLSIFIDMDKIENFAINREEFLKKFGLVEVKNSSVWPWLTNRLQYDTSKFMYNPAENYLIVLNLTPKGNILGVQKRNFKGPNKYLTYKLSNLYNLIKRDKTSIPEEIDMLSQIFNVCIVNYSRPVTLFEGPLDSFLFKNSISSTGVHKNLKIEIPIRHWYDDDKDGRQKSIEKINEGESVFLWNKFRNDFSLPYRAKWDLNDALIWLKDNGIKPPNFNEYFSNDKLDIIDI